MILGTTTGKQAKRYSPHKTDRYHCLENRPEMKQKRFSENAFIVWIGVMLCTMACLGGCRKEEIQASILPDKTPVIVKEITKISTKDVVFVSGSLEADKTAPLSFLIPGKTDRVYVDEGDHVKKGQCLATVESDDYQSNLQIAEAAVLRAKDAYNRYQPLYKEGAFAEKNFVELKVVLAQANAVRDIAHKKLKDTKLRTPIPGIVGAKNIEVGQMVSPEMPVFTIVKTDTIYARVSVPESEIGKITLGLNVVVKFPALDNRMVKGKVSLIGAMADPQTRSFVVKVKLSNRDYTLRSGMIVQAEIITNKKIDVLTVPGKAIVRDADNLTYVFTVDAQVERAFRRRVFAGSVFQSEIEIDKGLEPGDAVVVAGQHKLTDGAPVAIINAEDLNKGAE